jgi:hypothetical protein
MGGPRNSLQVWGGTQSLWLNHWVPWHMVFHSCLATKTIIVSAPLYFQSLEDSVWYGWLIWLVYDDDLVGWLGVGCLLGWLGILAPASTNQSIHQLMSINQVVASNAGACGVSTTFGFSQPQALSLLSLHTREGNISSGARRSRK